MTDVTLYIVDDEGYYTGGTLVMDLMATQPKGAVLADAPPAVSEGQHVRWNGDAWGLTGVPPSATRERPTPVPAVISKMQATLALEHFGDLERLEDQIASSGSRPLQLYWRDVSEIHRSHEAVEIMRVVMGWTKEQVDARFIFAKTIK